MVQHFCSFSGIELVAHTLLITLILCLYSTLRVVIGVVAVIKCHQLTCLQRNIRKKTALCPEEFTIKFSSTAKILFTAPLKELSGKVASKKNSLPN